MIVINVFLGEAINQPCQVLSVDEVKMKTESRPLDLGDGGGQEELLWNSPSTSWIAVGVA